MSMFCRNPTGGVFAALACDARIRILEVLNRAGGGWVDTRQLQVALTLTQSNSAKHLRILADAGLVERTKRTADAYRHGHRDLYRITPLAVDLVTRVVRDLSARPPRRPPVREEVALCIR